MLKRVLGWLEKMAVDQPVMLAFLVFLAATFVVVPLSIPVYGAAPQTFFENLLVEAHGFLFDLLIIGWFAVWLNRRAERRLRIRRYQEEIEDFLGWESLEAMHRLTGDIRRLSREGVSEINLRHAYLQGAYLVEINLAGAEMQGATLSSAKLQGARLAGTNLQKAQIELADLVNADLRGANLERANLTGAYLEGTNLGEACLSGANLKGAYLKRTRLTNADLERANLAGAYLEHTDLRGATISAEQLAQAKTLYGSRFDDALHTALHEQHARLFQAPVVAEDA